MKYPTRYLGNTNKKEVHDVQNEQKNCQLAEIVAAGHDKQFATLEDAHRAGYDNCRWCLEGSTR